VIDLPIVRVWAILDTPAAFLRHGVMLGRDALARA
jgi:hypothetical protein